MARDEKRTAKIETLRTAWRARGANTPNRAAFKLSVEHLQPGAISAARRETRRHSDDQVIRIAESILAFGFTAPVIVDRDGRIIAGHALWMAAKLLELEEIPVVRRDDLAEDEARFLALALNRLAERSEWDEQAVAEEFAHFQAIEHDLPLDLAITGFDTPEQDRYLALLEPSQDDEAEVPSDDQPVCTRAGDLWLADRHRVLCADATLAESYAQLMGDERAQMICADVPYNVPIRGHVSSQPGRREFAMASGEMSRPQFAAFLQTVFTHLAQYSLRPSVHLIFMDHRHLVEMMTAGEFVYAKLLNLICWVKNGGGGMGSLWRSRHELIFAWQNGVGSPINNVSLGVWGRNRSNVWEAPGANTFGGRGDALDAHPTPKPVSLLREAIKDVSHRGGVVLDPFLGGGATLIAAERTGRRCYAIEVDPAYVDASIRRWQQITGREAIHADTGLTFSALAAARSAPPAPESGVRLRSRPRPSRPE